MSKIDFNIKSQAPNKSLSIQSVLYGARELIKDEKNWAKWQWKSYNEETEEFSYCLIGAIRETAGDSILEYQCCQFLYDFIPSDILLSKFNDTGTHKEVLDLLDRAIASLENTQ